MFRRAAFIATMFATATAVAACGGSVSPGGSRASGMQRHRAALKLAQCMRTHGVPDFPDPQSGGGFAIQASQGSGGGSFNVDGHQINASQPAFRRAMQACQKYEPQGPPISGAQLARIKQGALKMAACMRRHGVPNFPDPSVSAGPGGRGIQVRIGLGAVDGGGAGESKGQGPPPAFRRAMSICQPLMGGGLKRRTA